MEDYNNQLRDHSSPRANFLYGNPVSAASTYGMNNNSISAASANAGTGGSSSSSFQHQYFQSDHHNSEVKSELAATTTHFLSQKFHHNNPLGIVRENNETERDDQRSLNTEDAEVIKAKIMSHPQCSSLLQAYMDCQKVGAPPQVVAQLVAARQEFENKQRSSSSYGNDASRDPELDQFMEAYYDMLVKYREELTRPLLEASDFMRRIESQLNMLGAPIRIYNPSDEKSSEGIGSSDEEGDVTAGGETDHQLSEIDPRAEDRELKMHLMKKYSGYLSSLKQELSKKRKKGKLPKEARQKLLSWWELHYKWPYPSETEKVALAESTGLDQKQINNWFINQRKRHWKPSEDIQFMVMDGMHHPNAAALYMDGHYMGPDHNSYHMGP